MLARRQLLWLFGASALAIACGATPSTLVVSAAASLQDALEAIAPQFVAIAPERALDFNFGSSGALQRQIESGAPADAFFSAGTQQMDRLAEVGAILPETRRAIVSNQLVAIVPKTSAIAAVDFARFPATDLQRIAVGEFRSVPAGQYARQVFEHFDILDSLQEKFVFGGNVRSVLGAVESGNVDLGLVYATDAARSDRVKIIATAPPESHSPIQYPIAITTASRQPTHARQFIDFLQSDTARKTFRRFGFTPL